jgi:lipopolysaccharide biosynthesis glycosyltransferase
MSENPIVPVVSAIDANYVPVYSVFLASLLAHVKMLECWLFKRICSP